MSERDALKYIVSELESVEHNSFRLGALGSQSIRNAITSAKAALQAEGQGALVERVAEATDFYGRMVQVMKPVWRERGNDYLTDTLLMHARQLQDAYNAAIAAMQGAASEAALIERVAGALDFEIVKRIGISVRSDVLDDLARTAVAAVQGAGIEALLERLTDDSLPGRDVRIGRNDGEWCVAQEYCGMDESVPTGITGNGATLFDAISAAVANVEERNE